MSTAADLRLTNADIELMPDDGKRYELIDGALYVSDLSYFLHRSTLVNIAAAVSEFLLGVGEHWIVDAENRSAEVYRRDAAGELVFDRNVTRDENLTSEVLPDS